MKVLVHNVDDQINVTYFTPEVRKAGEDDGEFFKRMAPGIVPVGVEYDVVDNDKIDSRYPGVWCKASQSMKYNWPAAYAQKLQELKQLQSNLLIKMAIDIEVAHDYDDDEKAAALVSHRKQVRKALDNLDLSHILKIDELASFIPAVLQE